MADAISVSGPVSGTDKTLTFATGVLAPQSQGAVVARHRRHRRPWSPPTRAKDIARASTSSPSPSTSRRRRTPPARSPARSSAVRAARPTRPSWSAASSTGRCARRSPTGYRNETQVVVTVLGADQENPHDVLAINGASAALMLSGLPFDGPIGAVRLAYSQDGTWIPHPTYQESEESTFEIVVAGRLRSTATTSPS